MSKPASDLRLFVAAYPSHESARSMAKALERLKLPPHKPTPREQIHLTLQFIGDVPQRELDETIESVQRAASGLEPFTLTPQRLITLPERGPARLIAAESDAPATLMELQRRLAVRLARNIREKDDRPFRPHLTLCRFRSPARGVTMDQPLAADAFEVSQILLMRSVLMPSGARHEEVSAQKLGL
jgi:2'-5' RNA ligase